ncbi:MAG: hypothetical protein K2F90_00235 [Clostridiales bacterium]|nr:hypothetical protein [Clostridiales bacterium]
MENDSFTTTAQKNGLTPERLDKVSAELYGILAAYDAKEVRAVVELIENGTPARMNSRRQGAGR